MLQICIKKILMLCSQ